MESLSFYFSSARRLLLKAISEVDEKEAFLGALDFFFSFARSSLPLSLPRPIIVKTGSVGKLTTACQSIYVCIAARRELAQLYAISNVFE